MSISFQHSEYFIVAIVAAAALLSLWLYAGFVKKTQSPKWLAHFLRISRFAAIFLIAIMLLVPFVQSISSYLEKPIVAVGFDNSESMQLIDSVKRRNVLTELEKTAEELGQAFDFKFYQFGKEVQPLENWVADEKVTNLDNWMNFVYKQHRFDNLAGLITVSDGVYNQGANPIYSSAGITAPHFTLGLGDTVAPKDLRIAYVEMNDFAYKGNSFPLKVGIEAERFSGESVKISLTQDGNLLDEKSLNIRREGAFFDYTFFVEAKEEGVQRFDLSLTKLEGEISYKNNEQPLFIEILEADRNVLLAYKSPHPDIAALRNSIERNKNYKIDLFWVDEPNAKMPKLEKYHLVVAHNLPARVNSDFSKSIENSAASVFYIFNQELNFAAFNQHINGLSLNKKGGSSNESFAFFNENFKSFAIDADMGKLADYPPLESPYLDHAFSFSRENILWQRIGSVPTKMPMLSVAESGNRKYAYLSGTGVWRWFVHNYSRDENFKTADALFGKLFQYLSVKDDKRRFKLLNEKFLFTENEPVKMTAVYLTKAYEPSDEADISAVFTNEQGQQFKFDFLPRNGSYLLNAGQLKPGTYQYSISGALGDEKKSLSGELIVRQVNVELMQPVANFNLLYQLAENKSGEFFTQSQIDELRNRLGQIEAQSIRHEKAEINELIHNKWWLLIIIFLLSIEWIIRKYQGTN